MQFPRNLNLSLFINNQQSFTIRMPLKFWIYLCCCMWPMFQYWDTAPSYHAVYIYMVASYVAVFNLKNWDKNDSFSTTGNVPWLQWNLYIYQTHCFKKSFPMNICRWHSFLLIHFRTGFRFSCESVLQFLLLSSIHSTKMPLFVWHCSNSKYKTLLHNYIITAVIFSYLWYNYVFSEICYRA